MIRSAPIAFLCLSLALPLAAGEPGAKPPAEAVSEAASEAAARSAREPVPETKAVKAAVEKLEDLFKKEYRARDREARAALGAKLLREGLATKTNPALRYACFEQALDLAKDAKSVGLALDATEAMVEHFDLPPAETLLPVLDKFDRYAEDDADLKRLANGYLRVAALQAEALDYRAAARQADDAQKYAKKISQSGGQWIYERAKALEDRYKDRERAAKRLAVLLASLEKKPEDADLHLQIGKLYALELGDWEKGLPYLAKGDDPKLQALAKTELAGPTLPDAFELLAEGWYAFAQERSNRAFKVDLLQKARPWYERVLPHKEGMERLEVQRRLETIYALLPAVDLVPLVRADLEARGGWRVKDGALVHDNPGARSLAEFAYRPPAVYDMGAVFTETKTLEKGGGAVFLMLPGLPKQAIWQMAAGQESGAGVDVIEGSTRFKNNNPTYTPLETPAGKKHKVVVQVRPEGIRVFVNDEMVLEYAEYGKLSRPAAWPTTDPAVAAVGKSYGSAVVFEKLWVREIGGPGEVLQSPGSKEK